MSNTDKAAPSISPIPAGFTTITPYFALADTEGFLAFLKSAFAAEIVYSVQTPEGTLGHCEVNIGTAKIMVCSSSFMPERPGTMYMYVPDADALFENAVAAGADVIQVPTHMYYGDYVGGVRDPFGNTWWIATHVEHIRGEELKERADKMWSGRRKE